MTSQYNELVAKLDAFIRKYYKNQILRGTLISLGIGAIAYLFAVVSEYFGHFSVAARTSVFYFLAILFFAELTYFIILPLLRFFKIGKVLTYKQAANIIATHFPDEVQDKLLNTLELAQMGKENVSPLLIASVNQKIEQIRLVPFKKAINLKSNFKYVKYLVALLLIFVVLSLWSPHILSEGTYRIVNHQTYFEPAAPFKFILENDSLFVPKGGDYKIKLRIEGEFIPKEATIAFGGNQFLMSRGETKKDFEYELKNINNTLEFRFEADNFFSQKFALNVLPTPVILDFSIVAEMPKYTGEENKTFQNTGDITVPFGTKLLWKFNSQDLDTLYITFDDSLRKVAVKDENLFTFSQAATQSCRYSISLKNGYFSKKDVISYSLQVIPDLYPNIEVQEVADSVNKAYYYFRGNVADDYGFSRLTFNYSISNKSETKPAALESYTKMLLKISNSPINQDFYHAIDFSKLSATTDDVIRYYFEIWDNDAIRGGKSAKTRIFEYRIPSAEELDKYEKTANSNIESSLQEGLKLAQEIQKDITRLQQKSVGENTTQWEKSNMLKGILNKQERLQQILNQAAKLNQEKNNTMNSYDKELRDEILEKQKQLEELMQNLMTDEMKKLLEELQKLQEQFNQNQFNKVAEDLKTNYEEMKKEMDRNLELLKRAEIEKNMEKAIERLNQMAENQEKLSEMTKDKKLDRDSLIQLQKMQEKEMQRLKESYDETLKKNSELSEPMKLPSFEKEMQEIQKEQQESQQDLQNKDNKKASQKQKNASEKMKKLAEEMGQAMQQMEEEENAENADDLRQVLDNLIRFSFEQEENIKATQNTLSSDPKFQEVIQRERKLNDDFRLIEDSLDAIAKRTPQVGTMFQKEVKSAKTNLKKALQNLIDRRLQNAGTNQQTAMTSANNLALILSESLENMQNQMNNSSGKGGKKSKKQGKGGKGNMSFSELKKQQEEMKNQMQQMLQQMKENGGKMPQNGNQQLSKMLQQQEMYDQMLREMMQNEGIKPETQKILNEIQKLNEKNKSDIVNKRVSPDILNRQNQIQTRLLEAENAERQKEQDKKRESKEVLDDKQYKKPEDIFKNKKEKSSFNENLNLQNLKMLNFYKTKYENYLKNINE